MLLPENVGQGDTMSHLRQILLDQRAALEDILRRSQALLDDPDDVFLDRLEDLMTHRAQQVNRIKKLESRRSRLADKRSMLDPSLSPIYRDIQASLATLAGMDSRLQSLIFDAQLELINNMAFTPRFVNLDGDATEEYHTKSRVVNVTR
ncbi:MAG: hypothetical protein IH971_03000 [Candidatus Marinimicrobia bacterium]|nr:hypothetical protein [Candidatus Neomarinimicrobiota bacterium]